MTATMTLEEVEKTLRDLVQNLGPADEVVITVNSHPVARLTAESTRPRKRRTAGSAKGKLQIVYEDDEHLRDFADAMQ